MNKTVTIKLPDGSKVYKHVRAKDEAELQAKIARIYADLTRGQKLRILFEEWYDLHAKSVATFTVKAYNASKRDILEYLGDKYLDEIKPRDVNDFILDLYEERQYARSTLTTRLCVLKSFFDYAQINGLCSANPCLPVKIPKAAEKHTRKLPTPDEIQTVIDSVNDDFGLFAFFLLYTGCRRGEALAIRYEDIDREKKTISITKSLVGCGRDSCISAPKTAAGVRTVPLLAPLEKVLPNKKHGYIFGNGEKPLAVGSFALKWREYVSAHDLSITPHQLRHAYATILYEAGLPVKDSQLLLGHSKAAVTQDIYQHITDKKRDQAFSMLQKHVSGD